MEVAAPTGGRDRLSGPTVRGAPFSIVREITVQCFLGNITAERDGYYGVATAISRTMFTRRAHILMILCPIVLACGLRDARVAAQEFLALGQSPPGPLLDDGEQGSWLDNVPNPAPAGEGIPDSVVGGTFAPNVASPTGPAVAPAEEFYQDGAVGGYDWPLDPYANESGAYGEMAPCPDCGNSLAVACPTCSPPPGFGEGFLSRGVVGLHELSSFGPIAGCRDLLQPVTRESWLFRPFSAGWFMGFMQGSELVEDWLGGYRFGWDIDPYWGCETRFGFASVALSDSDRAKAAQVAADIAKGLAPDNPYLHRFDTRRDSGIRVWDVEMLWYPYGDTYFRPYFLLGLGSARVDFMDRLSNRRIKSVLAMPIALGFKYRVRDRLALRVEATDNFIAGAGNGFKNLHNFSLTAGLEVRFGGTRTAYWPYYPGRHYW
jgi:hypothetical protein